MELHACKSPCDQMIYISIRSSIPLCLQIPLVPKCGLLQRLISSDSDGANIALDLHDIPGGEHAFELCAKFCYGITISLSAHNFVSAFCAAKFLRMTESIEAGNFVLKLEAFFSSCILEGWKDSIVALQATGQVPEWSENLGITRRCIDSVVEKILKPPSKVTWSYTYTRPGYQRKRHPSVPRDWWTEDISDLDIDLFRCIITAVRSTNMLPPQLIGEALHVYACRWLPEMASSRSTESYPADHTEQPMDRKQQILEMVVSLIPPETGSVSIGFLLRLLRIANLLGASPSTKAELVRKSGQQFEEATLNELMLPSDHHSYDIDLVRAMLESFLRQHWRRKSEGRRSTRSVVKVGKLIDCYLQVVAREVNMPVKKVVSLAAAVPEIARPEHDELYKAINIFLREHPNLTKADKKELCRILDCQKLSPQVRSHAVKNERLPLRTVVQVLFFDQEGGGSKVTSQKLSQEDQHIPHTPLDVLTTSKPTPTSKLVKQPTKSEGLLTRSTTTGGGKEAVHPKLRKSADVVVKLQDSPKSGMPKTKGEGGEGIRDSEKGKAIREDRTAAGNKLYPMKISQKKAAESQHSQRSKEG